MPGVNARPAEGFLDSVILLAPAITSDQSAEQNIVWFYGVNLFNHAYYWECHEVLEALWLRALPNSRERFLLQGIIHLANSALKEVMQQANAAERLKALAAECFERSPARTGGILMGLAVEELKCLAQQPRLGGKQLTMKVQYNA